MLKALKYYFIQELKELKYHLFGLLSIIIRYVLPLSFIFGQSVVKTETRTSLETWSMPIIVILVLCYFFAIRKAFRSKKVEEKTVARLDPKRAEPLRLVLFAVIDDCIMSPLIPYIFYLLSCNLEKLAVKMSDCFFAFTIIFLIGGVFKVIDMLVNMTRIFNETTSKDGQTINEQSNQQQ